MNKNEGQGVSNSSNQSESASPRRIHSPIKESDAEQKNANKPTYFVCQRDVQNPNEYRCRPIEGQPPSSGPCKSPPVSGQSPVDDPKTAGPRPLVAGNVETWTRADGSTVTVRRLKQRDKEMFMVVKDIPASSVKDQHRASSQKPAEVAPHEKESPPPDECDSGLCMEGGEEHPVTRKQDDRRRRGL